MRAGPKELNEDFVRSLLDNRSVIMVTCFGLKRSRLMATAQVGRLLAIQQGDRTAPEEVGDDLWAGNVGGCWPMATSTLSTRSFGASPYPLGRHFSKWSPLRNTPGQRSSRKRRG